MGLNMQAVHLLASYAKGLFKLPVKLKDNLSTVPLVKNQATAISYGNIICLRRQKGIYKGSGKEVYAAVTNHSD